MRGGGLSICQLLMCLWCWFLQWQMSLRVALGGLRRVLSGAVNHAVASSDTSLLTGVRAGTCICARRFHEDFLHRKKNQDAPTVLITGNYLITFSLLFLPWELEYIVYCRNRDVRPSLHQYNITTKTTISFNSCCYAQESVVTLLCFLIIECMISI